MSEAPSRDSLAEALGVAPTLVSRYRKRGMPIDSIEAAKTWKAANVRVRVGTAADGAAKSVGAAQAVSVYSDHRTRQAKVEADLAEIELAKAQGKILDRESSLRAIFTKFRELRDDAAGLGRRLAPQLVAMSDEREMRIAIDREMRLVFESFSKRQLQGLANQFNGAPVAIPTDLVAPFDSGSQLLP